jgi:hypothetical protein
MDVSINYPWGIDVQNGQPKPSGGWDFGDPPAGHGFIGNDGQRHGFWVRDLRRDLQLFRQIGLKAVRFAILFDGTTYGTDAQAPQRVPGSTLCHFVPRRLSDRFIADFRLLLRLFADANASATDPIRLLPVIVGFDFVRDLAPHANVNHPDDSFFREDFGRGRLFVKGRRGQAFSLTPLPNDAREGVPSFETIENATTPPTYQDAFLHHVLDRLLAEFEPPNGPLANYRHLIHSWEVFAEPEMVTAPPREAVRHPYFISNDEMLAYLRKGIRMVRDRGFRATVGFQRSYTRANWNWRLPHHLCQFHYYGDEPLPRITGNAASLIGEAATGARDHFDQRFYLTVRDRNIGSPVSLTERLEWFEHVGYREVFLWSAERIPPTSMQSWTEAEHRAVYQFTHNVRTRSYPPLDRSL